MAGEVVMANIVGSLVPPSAIIGLQVADCKANQARLAGAMADVEPNCESLLLSPANDSSLLSRLTTAYRDGPHHLEEHLNLILTSQTRWELESASTTELGRSFAALKLGLCQRVMAGNQKHERIAWKLLQVFFKT